MNKFISSLCVIYLVLGLSSCSVVGGIFKAGVWAGVLAVVVIIGLIIFFIIRGSKKN